MPTIYAYTTPSNTESEGWIKIGYTERDASQRINEQTHTAGITPTELWHYEARFNGGKYFKDHEFHSFLIRNRIKRREGTEWFYFNGEPEKSEALFKDFVFNKKTVYGHIDGTQYYLRNEQEEAVQMTLDYFKTHEKGEFLWNAKPRFGKTLSSYDLARKLDAVNVLIVTNRPAIANSWYDDFEKFIEWQTDYKFVSESASLKDKPTFSHEEFKQEAFRPGNDDIRRIVFIGLQDLKGSLYFGGSHDKYKWVADSTWDLLIIDEAHEGIDTLKTDVAFENVKRKNTLHLSGTPFKQIANSKFSSNQIYNWSYTDEQDAKENWSGDTYNPYSNLPKLNMYTYQMSNMILDELEKGAATEDDDGIDYAFDLNEFFSTKESGKFTYEDDVKKWLDTLTTNEKYPFSTKKLRNELNHTFWLLNRVDSARAMVNLLKEHPVFENYNVILAAGDGKVNMFDGVKNEEALHRVQEAIDNNKKTITISVGQLTTGVTVPEWSAVLMLSNVKSPALYMQAAFRAQNPHQWIDRDARGIEKVYQKKNAYVFDFSPERTLTIVDEFANNLLASTANGGGTMGDREQNIQRLLNFFPVIGEDSDGKMTELDARQVLTIPKNIKAREVVRRGFMSNLLFANIAGIFQAPKAALDIINQFEKTEQGKKTTDKNNISSEELKEVEVDDELNVVVDEKLILNQSDYIFGEKKYEEAEETVVQPEDLKGGKTIAGTLSETVVKSYEDSGVFNKLGESYKLTKNKVDKIRKVLKDSVEEVTKRVETDLKIQQAHIESEFKEKVNEVTSDIEREQLVKDLKEKKEEAITNALEEIKEKLVDTTQKFERETIETQETQIKEKEKLSIEDEIRSRLRGFARTIPSFIMAYGDENLTLQNFEQYTPEDVFKEVTGITIEQFVFLRDGGNYDDNGEMEYYKGQLFNDIVFNESVLEFLRKREELADYFEDKDEDIFDYIPNQKTNQIFTPKWVVQMMVQQLEDENPGIYDNSNKTFIDLYMKSGLYITEIVKRLYNSEVIMGEIPDNHARLKHILENQVHGLAPTEIIYRIAVRFIFGNQSTFISQRNFKQLDAYPYAEAGTLEEKLDDIFKI